MDHWLALLLLAALQGLTEFLPISSSGHLSLAHRLFGLQDGALLLDVVLHAGTLAAVVVVYRSTLTHILLDSWRGLLTTRRDGWRQAWHHHDGLRLAAWVILATLPTGLIGVLLKDLVEQQLRAPLLVALMLAINGMILWTTRRRQHITSTSGVDAAAPSHTHIAGLGWRQAVIIGVLQGLAVTPGISRSGTTIAGALALGVSATEAARFSFVLSIPAILGALVLKLGELGTNEGAAPALSALVVGALVAALVGFACLVLLLGLLRRARFHHFAWYCWLLAGLVVVWQLAAG